MDIHPDANATPPVLSQASAVPVVEPRAAEGIVRLYCYAYAGGSGAVFRAWRKALPGIHVVPMELPGRGTRVAEKKIHDYAMLVDLLAAELAADLRRSSSAAGCPPFAIFGHSAGARFGFAAAARAAGRLGVAPSHCFLSASAPFDLTPREPARSRLGDAELIAELRALGGTPPQVLDDPELMRLVLPVLRADFCAGEKSHLDADLRVDWPLTLMAADRDRDVSAHDVWGWSRHTSGPCERLVLDGDHFSVLRDAGPLLAAIRERLSDRSGAHDFSAF